eukprot:8827335-Heterocapsa_arctica.AAC.1
MLIDKLLTLFFPIYRFIPISNIIRSLVGPLQVGEADGRGVHGHAGEGRPGTRRGKTYENRWKHMKTYENQ